MFHLFLAGILFLSFQGPWPSMAENPYAIASVRDGGRYSLCLLEAGPDGTLRQLSRFPANGEFNAGTPAMRAGRVAFACDRGGKYDIWLATLKELFPPSDAPTPPGPSSTDSPIGDNLTGLFQGSFSHPAFLPDGSICFSGTVNGRISVFSTTDEGLRELTPGFASAGQPSGAPSGVAGSPGIAFTAIESDPPGYDGRTDIYRLDTLSGVVTRLTEGNVMVGEGHPFLNRNGGLLFNAVFGSYSGGAFVAEKSEIHRIFAEGHKHECLAGGPGIRSCPREARGRVHFLKFHGGSRDLYRLDAARGEFPLTTGLFIASYTLFGE